MSDAVTGMIACRLRRRRNMQKDNTHPVSSAENRLSQNTVRRNFAETQGIKTFDRYEDCDCVDRWEAEGGRVVGEAQPSH